MGAGPFLLDGGRVLLQNAAGVSADLLRGDAQFLENLKGDAVLITQKAQQEVFGANVVVAQPSRLGDCPFERALRGRGEALPSRFLALFAGCCQPGSYFSHPFGVQAQVVQHSVGNPAVIHHQAEQHVLRAD